VYEVYKVTRIIEAEEINEAILLAEGGKGEEVCRVYDSIDSADSQAEEIS